MSNNEKEPVQKQVCILGDNRWRMYLLFENDVLVEEKFVNIDNNKEIPCEEIGQRTYSMMLPTNCENDEKIKIIENSTGLISKELLKVTPINKTAECICVKIFNQTRNIGEIHKLVNGVDIETKYFKVADGKEEYCEQPNDEGGFFALVPFNLEGPLPIYDSEGKLFRKVPDAIVASLDEQTEITFQHDDEANKKCILEKISSLSDEDKKRLKLSLENKEDTITTLEGKRLSRTHYSEIERAVDALISSQKELVNDEFYKSVNSFDEFGISRFVVDRFYHLPQLLSEPTLTRQPGTTTYIISSKTHDSKGNSICLEHRFQATSPEEATKLAKLIIKRLQGIQHKIWLGAWCLANELKKYTYTCSLTELMRLCHPERNAYFQTKEKIEFYEHLKSLESTKIVFTRKRKKTSRSKKEIEDFIEIRALEISMGTRKPGKKYPDSLAITVLNTTSLQNEKMAFVGAGYKHRTLELHADDALFAQEIQTRKNQMQHKKLLRFDREYLIKLAGLVKTDKTKKAEANKLLLEKLQRLNSKGIILDVPKRISERITLMVR